MRQFWHTLFLKTNPSDLERVRVLLSAGQWALFTRLQPGEKNHAIRMLDRLLEGGENLPDLLVAALLHDIGKVCYPMNPFERAMVVLVRAVKPELVQQWGSLQADGWENLPGWRKAFIVAEQHPEWGAEMARQVEVSSLTESLIRHHQHSHNLEADEAENYLPHRLWMVDNEN